MIFSNVINIFSFHLIDVKYKPYTPYIKDRKVNIMKLDMMYVSGRHIRYVHIPEHINISDALEKQVTYFKRNLSKNLKTNSCRNEK